jgi:monoamine oxidase
MGAPRWQGEREPGVVVVGAGVAGLAAARALRAADVPVVVLEAGRRAGGRAWTSHPALLGGGPFDEGAQWLHDAERNPLARLAEAAGDPLQDAWSAGTRRVSVDGRPATPEEEAAFDRSWDGLEARAEPLLAPGRPDVPLAAALDPADPWSATVGAWEGAIIAAADADRLSLHDWWVNRLDGQNLRVPGGLGALVLRRLAAGRDVELETPALRVRWAEPWGVSVETPRGTLRAGHCIVTCSTGVLAAGAIRFEPPLPAPVDEAIHGLPMGLLSKVALRAADADRLGMPDDCLVMRRIEPGQPAASINLWGWGGDRAVVFVGGQAAWDLSVAGPGAGEAFARDLLRRLFGARADRAFRPGAVETGWGTDPLFLGAYAYAAPGNFAMRERLAEPVGDGRLLFAGEATRTDGLAGTAGGAFLAGAEAATYCSSCSRATRKSRNTATRLLFRSSSG